MELEHQSQRADASGIPSALDARVLGLVIVVAGLAASVNVPYGGPLAALAAFAILVCVGVAGHLHGERTLRQLTGDLVDRWVEEGGHVYGVSQSSNGMRTEWIVHTPDGDVTVGGLALSPICRLSVEWRGIADTTSAATANAQFDRLAEDLYREIFADA
ncbi:hypothetical protein ACFQGT_01905 [Natrialbaceae archaeon GCM10025810]|uniref:hypothetical protein n=1 Tax=Halovalidus salilacus TaxID=3075124 RepID=UPI00361A6953